MQYPPYFKLGYVLEDALDQAVRNWKETYAPATPVAELLTSGLTSVTIEATMFPGGRLSVITTLRGRRQLEDETHLFRYTRRANKQWVRRGSSLPST